MKPEIIHVKGTKVFYRYTKSTIINRMYVTHRMIQKVRPNFVGNSVASADAGTTIKIIDEHHKKRGVKATPEEIIEMSHLPRLRKFMPQWILKLQHRPIKKIDNDPVGYTFQ